MTTAEDDPDQEHDSQATEVPAPAAETPTRLQQAAAGNDGSAGLEGAADRKGLAQARGLATRTEGGRGVTPSPGPSAAPRTVDVGRP